jgi:curved DNA-binding protein CbpA
VDNPYQILRIRPDANDEQIEDAYQRMRRLVAYGGAGEGVNERAVNSAYAILSDPERRERIDRAILSRKSSPATASQVDFFARLRRMIPFR